MHKPGSNSLDYFSQKLSKAFLYSPMHCILFLVQCIVFTRDKHSIWNVDDVWNVDVDLKMLIWNVDDLLIVGPCD